MPRPINYFLSFRFLAEDTNRIGDLKVGCDNLDRLVTRPGDSVAVLE